jgi:hypothetical protein
MYVGSDQEKLSKPKLEESRSFIGRSLWIIDLIHGCKCFFGLHHLEKIVHWSGEEMVEGCSYELVPFGLALGHNPRPHVISAERKGASAQIQILEEKPLREIVETSKSHVVD